MTRNEQILDLYAKGWSYEAIGGLLGISRSAVSGVVNRSGAKNRGGQRFPVLDLTRQRFGKWLVLRRARNLDGKSAWRCLCDCGETRIIRGFSLASGSSKSCGCATGKGRKPMTGSSTIEDELDAAKTREAAILLLRSYGWDYASIARALEVSLWKVQTTVAKNKVAA